MPMPELMPDWETDLRGTFRNKLTVHSYQRNVISLHKALENYTGEKYVPPKKPLYDKMLDVLKHHDEGSDVVELKYDVQHVKADISEIKIAMNNLQGMVEHLLQQHVLTQAQVKDLLVALPKRKSD